MFGNDPAHVLYASFEIGNFFRTSDPQALDPKPGDLQLPSECL